jgi:hypothetical protein
MAHGHHLVFCGLITLDLVLRHGYRLSCGRNRRSAPMALDILLMSDVDAHTTPIADVEPVCERLVA